MQLLGSPSDPRALPGDARRTISVNGSLVGALARDWQQLKTGIANPEGAF
jgi:hypothetical protein